MRALDNLLVRFIPYDVKSHEWPQILVIFVACVGSFNLGALFCWTSPSMPILTSNSSHIEPISLDHASYFTVIPPISAAITSPFIAILVDAVGRKKTVMFMAIPQLLSWILIASAENIYIFYLSRFITGIGDAALFCALPTYVGEVATPKVRGSWGNLVAICIYFGQFMINVVGAYCNIRTTAIIFGCIPIVHFLLFALMPESPYFLLMKGKEDEARVSLQMLRWKENVDDELRSLNKDVQRQISELGTFKDLVTIPTNRKALLISIAIRGAQQLSGLSAFATYTQRIFEQAGGHLSASTSAIIFSGIMVAANAAFSFVVDKFGRRRLMIFSCLGCGVVLCIESTFFYIASETDIDTSGFKWVPLAGMLGYILVCSTGLGIIPTLMLGELFSASIKGKALCILNICFSIYVLSVSKLYYVLSHTFSLCVPFYVFTVCCFASAIFSYYFVPETKGKTLEEIQQSLRRHSVKKDFVPIKF